MIVDNVETHHIYFAEVNANSKIVFQFTSISEAYRVTRDLIDQDSYEAAYKKVRAIFLEKMKSYNVDEIRNRKTRINVRIAGEVNDVVLNSSTYQLLALLKPNERALAKTIFKRPEVRKGIFASLMEDGKLPLSEFPTTTSSFRGVFQTHSELALHENADVGDIAFVQNTNEAMYFSESQIWTVITSSPNNVLTSVNGSNRNGVTYLSSTPSVVDYDWNSMYLTQPTSFTSNQTI